MFALKKSPLVAMLVGERVFFPENSAMTIQPLFGLVILSNFVGSAVLLVALGMRVGAAREKYGVKLPEMYSAEKGSNGELTDNARLFNCVQRGHHQALETYPHFLILSAVSGIQYPITTSLMGVLWIVSRRAWADGYATGTPINRYAYSVLGPQIWTPLLVSFFASVATSIELLSKVKLA